MDRSSIAWGACSTSPNDQLPDFHAPLSMAAGVDSIKECVVPDLVGQKVITFRSLARLLESLRQKVTIRKPTIRPENEARGVSRREIISGFLASPRAEEERFEEMVVERPIHPSIRHGVSQALLSAVALVRGVSTTQVICEEFDLSLPSTAVDLQIHIKRGQRLQLHNQISSLSYSVGRTDFEQSLGANGERVQRFVRQLRESLDGAGHQRQITIHLDVAGGLGQIFGQDIGKILGALYGLEQAAAPHLIRVQDPLILDNRAVQIETLSQLRNYLRMRRMSLQLVASVGINTLDDVRTFVQGKAAHMLHLVMPRHGTFQEVAVASAECQAHGIGILLEGYPSAVTSQVALALQPDVLTYPAGLPTSSSIAAIHNEMARTLAWLARETE